MRARSKDERAFERLMRDHEPEIRKLASRFFISGSERQDVIQEGRIGLWKAVHDFDPAGGMTFRNFANLCCRRHIITAMAAANRKKYDPLNNAVSLDMPIATSDDDSEQSLADFIQDPTPPTINLMETSEEFSLLSNKVRRKLTQLEEAIFTEYTFDGSYKDIADELGISSKTVDNALIRVRSKSREVFSEYIKESVKPETDVG